MGIVIRLIRPTEVVEDLLHAYPVFQNPEEVRRVVLLLIEKKFIKKEAIREFLDTAQQPTNDEDLFACHAWQQWVLLREDGPQILGEIVGCGTQDSKKMFLLIGRLYTLEQC